MYTNCYNEFADADDIEGLGKYLAWYDAVTMGGKFSVCDLGYDYVVGKFQHVFNFKS